MAKTAIEVVAPIKRGAKVIVETNDQGKRVGVSGRVTHVLEEFVGSGSLPAYHIELDDDTEITVSKGRIVDVTGRQRVENGTLCPPQPYCAPVAALVALSYATATGQPGRGREGK